MPFLASANSHASLALVEIGAVVLVLSLLARLASRIGIPSVPLYLLAGLAVGKGGIAPLDISADFISIAAEIGVLLLLLTLGLEYTAHELRRGLRSGARSGVVDALANFTPGFALGMVLGWGATAAVLLGGVCWVSSSGVASQILRDFGWSKNAETSGVLNLLVVEDLAMAAYLPVVAALAVGRSAGDTALSVAIALGAVAIVLGVALRWGARLSRLLSGASDESLLLHVFGVTLLVGGLAQRVQVSAAIGAFLVGLGLAGKPRRRATELISPLRDLFAATFFLFFSFQIDASDLPGVAPLALLLLIVTGAGKFVTGRAVTTEGRWRAGATLLARGEFSVIIASLGSGLAKGEELGALAACYVLMTAVAGPLVAKYVDRREAVAVP